MTNPLTSLPTKVRQGLYGAYALAGVGLGVAAVYGVDVGEHGAALGIIGAAFGFTALSNTSEGDQEADGDHRA